ncbi:MAG: BACON domain-containing carbohydrate-binding protein [Bacteroidetes bacterium]|nr:BACON domain-containing carbohydrate-binding protein [Bacteroidota bacterium]
MKKIFHLISTVIFCILVAFAARAQNNTVVQANDTAHFPYWIQMMQDPSAGFHATQSAFEKYWQGRTDYKGNGWKVFKRWEYINKSRVQPDGKLPAPGSVAKEFNRYRQTHSQRSLNGAWTQVGPINIPANATGQPNGMGRINAAAFHPTDANTFYVGSASGGFWKTMDAGITWANLTSNLPTLGVSAILIHPSTPNTIFIGTGDRDGGDAPGMGVYKSTDGGVTFLVSNSGMGSKTVGMMVMHPTDPNTILAATSGGIHKSIDGGATWLLKSSNANNYKDIKFKPGDPTTVYATENGKFYRSTNTGDSWTQITAGVITGTRLTIGVSINQPTYVYLLMTNGVFVGLLRSTNSGVSFTTQSTTPNLIDYSCDGSGNSSQAWYDLCIAVDPNNANILYTGGINIWKSTNSGVNWTIASHWVGSSWGETCAPSVHADIHSLDWSPLNGKLYTGCDGGFYNTANGGTTWTDLSSGLAVAQVYKIGQSATKNSLCINGYQDNGTSSNSNSAFTTVIGGDGMECIIDYSDTNYRYGEIYYGDIYRRSTGTNNWNYITNNISESGGWVTPYILHETNPNTMFVGAKNVWRSTNVKASNAGSVTWTAISSGETSSCTVLEQSPANVDILYVVRSGSLKRSENANSTAPTWITCTLPGGGTPTDLEAHPTDPNIVYATAGYKVYKSINKGASWTDISGTLPSIYTNCIVYDKNNNEPLYVGNETGIFYKDGTMSDWTPFNTGLPITDVRELEIYYDAAVPANNRLKAATYGRGLWQSDLYDSFSVTPPNQNVPASPTGITTFNVTAPSTWTAVSNSTWCIVPPSGTGNSTLVASYSENLTVNTRIATITVTPASGSPISVTVTQTGAAPTLNVIPPNQDVPSPAGSTTFTVTSNTNWNVVCDSAWCTVTPSGTGNGTINANYTDNLTINLRIAHITVTVSGLTPVIVTVTQSGVAPTLIVMPTNQYVNALAGDTNFIVTSNSSWTVSSDVTWCTATPSGTGNGTIVANYQENQTYSQRIATITVTVSGVPPTNVTVTQAASTVGINPGNTGKGIQLYPNPAKGSFYVIPNEYRTQTLEVKLIDLTGRLITSRICKGENEYRFDVTAMQEGSYFVKIKTDNLIMVKRLIIRR